MQYLLLIYRRSISQMTEADGKQMSADYGAFTPVYRQSGNFKGGDRLIRRPWRRRCACDGRTLTTDGPFAETHEQLGGYYLIDAKDPTWRSPSPRIPGRRSVRSSAPGLHQCSWHDAEQYRRIFRDETGRALAT